MIASSAESEFFFFCHFFVWYVRVRWQSILENLMNWLVHMYYITLA